MYVQHFGRKFQKSSLRAKVFVQVMMEIGPSVEQKL